MNLHLIGEHRIGKIVNVNRAAYRIIATRESNLRCFPGGQNLTRCTVEKIADEILTVGQCARIELGESVESVLSDD